MKTNKIFIFSIACSVVAVIVAPLALLFYLSNAVPVEKHSALVTIWCVLPFVWGFWALLMPGNWLPHRLPHWGALLGIILGVIVVLVLDFTNWIFDLSLSMPSNVIAVLIIGIVYYFLWMIVRKLYVLIQPLP